MTGMVRRVVTAQTATGKATITSDGPAPTVFALENGPTLIEIWKTAASPVSLRVDAEEPAAGPLTLHPPTQGSVFRIADIPPDIDGHGAEAARVLFAKMGEAGAATAHGEGNAMMHRTPTLDYALVLDGEITLVVDTGEVALRAGDVIIQRGANHAWSNRSGKTCRMAFIMIDASYPTT
jgi:hypothetical protein